MSALATARQSGLEVATRQTTSGFVFMQKPSAVRQKSDWSYQLHRVSRQTLPPIVPMLRSCGVLTTSAACASAVYRSRTRASAETAVRVVPALISRRPFSWMPAASRTPASDTSSSGANWRRFMFGKRSVPPATSITRSVGVPRARSSSAAPCSRRRVAASR